MSTWRQMIVDLEASGMTLTGIGDRIDLSTASVSDIKQGRTREPRGMSAVRLYELHSALKSRDAGAHEAAA